MMRETAGLHTLRIACAADPLRSMICVLLAEHLMSEPARSQDETDLLSAVLSRLRQLVQLRRAGSITAEAAAALGARIFDDYEDTVDVARAAAR